MHIILHHLVVVLTLDSPLSVPLCRVMDPEQLGRTLDLLVGQMNNISQQLKENQVDLVELRRTTTDRFDTLERVSRRGRSWWTLEDLLLAGDLIFVDGGRQGEEDPIDVIFYNVVNLKVDVEKGRSKHIYSSLIIVDESMILRGIDHSWILNYHHPFINTNSGAISPLLRLWPVPTTSPSLLGISPSNSLFPRTSIPRISNSQKLLSRFPGHIRIAVQKFQQRSFVVPLSGSPLLVDQKFPNPQLAVNSCMADPEQDHDFVFDEQALINILRSPFFDIDLENNRSVEEYMERILFSLAAVIDQRRPPDSRIQGLEQRLAFFRAAIGDLLGDPTARTLCCNLWTAKGRSGTASSKALNGGSAPSDFQKISGQQDRRRGRLLMARRWDLESYSNGGGREKFCSQLLLFPKSLCTFSHFISLALLTTSFPEEEEGKQMGRRTQSRIKENKQYNRYILTCASRHKLIIPIGEWHQEEYRQRNKSLPAGFINDCFKRFLKLNNSVEGGWLDLDGIPSNYDIILNVSLSRRKPKIGRQKPPTTVALSTF
ncbi:hypothetical protein M5K25_005473 [Dendrobium thyrsiflorum]|uniref:Uncharacterized protein n=1 Tax=Dendrobium thyrsiflorum TaxID=117978 RepID=A0ABD0VPS2_DENTH